jgi:hypothetical protein
MMIKISRPKWLCTYRTTTGSISILLCYLYIACRLRAALPRVHAAPVHNLLTLHTPPTVCGIFFICELYYILRRVAPSCDGMRCSTLCNIQWHAAMQCVSTEQEHEEAMQIVVSFVFVLKLICILH